MGWTNQARVAYSVDIAVVFFVRGHNEKIEFKPFAQVNEVLSEVSLIKDRQEDIDGKLDTMKNENEALWREVDNLCMGHNNFQ